MALKQLSIRDFDLPLAPEVQEWLRFGKQRIQTYWDSFAERPLPQYVECDFELVAATLSLCHQRGFIDGSLFVEWGAGFGIVTGIAAANGFEAVGIEAEEFLCEEATKLFAGQPWSAEIWHGNFLPRGARELAIDEDPVVSLSHAIPPAYEEHDLELEDFACVFAYPWPGEEHFLRLVFDRFARSGALMIMYRGPNQIEVMRRR
ncbi:MAG TPA: hypothetical protein DDW52_17510 [Planctomycetaceae bacterium]|nr:hypothetical protein [Planctomycetaceae bacterium]